MVELENHIVNSYFEKFYQQVGKYGGYGGLCRLSILLLDQTEIDPTNKKSRFFFLLLAIFTTSENSQHSTKINFTLPDRLSIVLIVQ